jgi:hypothetical protein
MDWRVRFKVKEEDQRCYVLVGCRDVAVRRLFSVSIAEPVPISVGMLFATCACALIRCESHYSRGPSGRPLLWASRGRAVELASCRV